MVCTVNTIPFSDLRKEAMKIFGLEKDHLDSALIAQLHAPELDPTTPVTISYPMKKHISLDENVYKVDVIQRTNVVSTHHFGNYDTLEQSFPPLFDYIEKKGYTPVFPMCIIFHKSVKYKALFKRNPDEFVTEVQIPIDS